MPAKRASTNRRGEGDDALRPSKVEVVTLALAEAGGRTQSTDTEDVAVAAFKLAPDSFAWRKYPDQINLDSVRVTLFDACKEKYGALVEGSLRQGWNLSTRGIAWVDSEAATAVRRALGHVQPEVRGAVRSETRHTASELARVRRTEAYRDWKADKEVSARNAAAVFRIDAYTTPTDRTLKTNRLLEALRGVMDDEESRFISEMVALAESYSGMTKKGGDPDGNE